MFVFLWVEFWPLGFTLKVTLLKYGSAIIFLFPLEKHKAKSYGPLGEAIVILDHFRANCVHTKRNLY